MDQLPLVLLLKIAEESVSSWKSFVFAHPRVGRWSLNPEYQKYIQRRFTQCFEYKSEGNIIVREYKLCNKRHNLDDPAIEYKGGTKMWYRHGKIHRNGDLPAIDNSYGTKEWYINGERHRNGDLPAIEYSNGDKYWYENGLLHRNEDLPAVEFRDGTKKWYRDGKLHRDGDLPAIQFGDGTEMWFRNGNFYQPEQ